MEQLLHTPEGVRDIYNGEYARKLKVERQIQHTMNLYGFQDIQTPGFEFFDIFRKERGSVAPTDMFKFFDREGNTLVLRPDMTPSIARCAAKYYADETVPVRLCYLGNTYINNLGYQGRLKECTDAGAELIGDGSAEADAEMVAMVIACLLSTGLKEFQIELGHAGFFDSLLDETEITGEQRDHLRQLYENKNYFGVESQIAQLGISEEKQQIFRKLPELFGSGDVLTLARTLTNNSRTLETVERLEQVDRLLDCYGFQKYVSFDLGMMVSYRYYTGIIFKGYTYGTGDTIISGGRYDTLMAQFGKDRPSVGFKISVDGLLSAMERQNIAINPDRVKTMLVYSLPCREQGIRLASLMREKNVNLALFSLEGYTRDEFQKYGRNMEMDVILFIEEDGSHITVTDLKKGCCQTVDFETFLKGDV